MKIPKKSFIKKFLLITAISVLILIASIFILHDLASPEHHACMQPLFGVDVTYGYVERPADLSADVPIFNVVLNFTRYSEVDLCDAIFEVHLIEVYSDEGSIGNVTRAQGIQFNHSTSTLRQAMGLKFDEFAEYGHVGSGASASWPVNHSVLLFFVGDKTTCVPDFGEPETVFVRVSRLGLVTIKGDSSEAVVLSEPEVVAEAQLEKFVDGFLYNTIIPEDQLSEIDLLNPPIWVFFE